MSGELIEITSASELMGDPAHVYGLTPDPAFSDRPLNEASTQAVGKMDFQEWGHHNSGNISFVGPTERGQVHNSDGIWPASTE